MNVYVASCFCFFSKNCIFANSCLYDPTELSRHNFIITTRVISNKVVLFQCFILDLYCIHSLKILLIFVVDQINFESKQDFGCFQTSFFYIKGNFI